MRSTMPSLFNMVRTGLYCATLVSTVICLGMAGRFISALSSSDLTRFVPFSVFVCAASLMIIISLLAFSFCFRERNPISTRIELGCLGLAGLLWLVLGAYLASSESKDAEVECYSSDSSTEVLGDELASFHTEQYKAMYRVLIAFAFLNMALLNAFCLLLLLLAIRRHRKGDVHMWQGPVTSCAWFNDYSAKGQTRRKPTLPTHAQAAHAPAPPPLMRQVKTDETFTAPPPRRDRSARKREYGEVPKRQRSSRSQGQSRPDRERSHRSRAESRTRQFSGSSLIGSTTDEYDSGMMANPNRAANRKTNL